MSGVIQKKKTKIINALQNPELTRLIEDPANLGISLHFPISSLLKSNKCTPVPKLSTYSLTSNGFKDWRA
ncbi:hypothetical protein SEUBUCD646_0P02300 [Saccharomyces eubayanus]|uniref:Uncharacterized protein n=1 Tax=Saccharomyces eubayanus TaxID=1080349 RepID=A0ABN8VJ99_SACEU|nr:hypothetical protein SEUBUCD650_0P02310 [Saccharomyces eubayanus]CAI1799782.1 hypothetical protein SEUBUCD646_0P02300 [Saccharomyces eubayanus]